MAFKTLAALLSVVSVGYAASIVERATDALPAACNVWVQIRDNLIENRFDGGECGEEVHESLRLTFHDAIGFSRSGAQGGGADGSIATFGDVEQQDSANLGTEDAADQMLDLANQFNVSTGDIIQFAGAVGVALCPGAPRIPVFVGRPAPKVPAAQGLVPEPFQPVSDLIARFNDAGFSSAEMVALLASHTVAAQDHIDPTVAGSPFDSTPGFFDTQIFVETLLKGDSTPGATLNKGQALAPLQGELRLQSDGLIARDSRTACEWQSFVNNQAKLRSAFSAAMVKMGQLGQNPRRLTDCSAVVPTPPSFNRAATFPAGKSNKDVQQSCRTTPFPTLATDPGAQTSVAPVPPS